jgi:hypothetical protein
MKQEVSTQFVPVKFAPITVSLTAETADEAVAIYKALGPMRSSYSYDAYTALRQALLDKGSTSRTSRNDRQETEGPALRHPEGASRSTRGSTSPTRSSRPRVRYRLKLRMSADDAQPLIDKLQPILDAAIAEAKKDPSARARR